MTQPISAPSVNYNRAQLLIILLTPILVVLSSTALYFSGWLMPNERSNNGILLQPVLSVTDLGLPAVEITQDRQWRIIQLSENCASSCEEKMFEQRQMHIALGKLQPRLQRVLLTATPAESLAFDDFPNLEVVSFQSNQLTAAITQRIPAAELEQNPVFVADPFGNIMLYFNASHDYKAQMSDLKKLLKLSTIG